MIADGGKLRAAGLSVVSNSSLILLKAIAASVTGSVSILTERSTQALTSSPRSSLLSPSVRPASPRTRRIARRARASGSPALEGDAAHLRTDALTSPAVFVGLALVKITGAEWPPAVALAVAGVILITGVRLLTRASQVLIDTSLPRDELTRSATWSRRLRPGASSATTSCAPGGRATAATSTSISSSRRERRSRTPTARPMKYKRKSANRLSRTDVLIHLEPEDRVRPGERI